MFRENLIFEIVGFVNYSFYKINNSFVLLSELHN